MQIEDGDEVFLDGRRLRLKKEHTYLLFYKPRGVVCTESRKEKNNIIDYLNYPQRVTYAGRLDKDSEGLILMTDDGMLIRNLMRAGNRHEKEYEVRVDRDLDRRDLEQMERGVYLEDLARKTRKCRITVLGKRTFRIVLTEGMNRQIRRMCGKFGYGVRELKRIRIVNLTAGSLRPGEYRKLTDEEVKSLRISGGDAG